MPGPKQGSTHLTCYQFNKRMERELEQKKTGPEVSQDFIDPRRKSGLASFFVFILIFLNVGRAHEAIGGPIRITLIASILGAAFCAGPFMASPAASFKKSSTLRRISYFTLWAIATIPFSRWPGGSVQEMLWFLKVYLFLLLMTILSTRFKTTYFALFSFTSSLLTVLFFSVLSKSSSMRVSSITHTYDPNEMALLAVMILPILYFSAKQFRTIPKLACYGGVVISVVSVALSGSRGGLLGLFAVGVYILFVSSLGFAKKVLITAMAILVFFVVIPQENLTRLTNTINIQDDYNMSAQKGRLTIWKHDLAKIIKNPLTGVGFGQSSTLEPDEVEGGAWMEAHNSYIQIALETGLPGFLILFPVLLMSARRLRELRKTLNKNDRRMAIVYGLESSLWGYFICITFLSVIYHPLSLYFFLLIETVYLDIKGNYLIPVQNPNPGKNTKGRSYRRLKR